MKLGDIIARQLTDPIRFILLNRRKGGRWQLLIHHRHQPRGIPESSIQGSLAVCWTPSAAVLTISDTILTTSFLELFLTSGPQRVDQDKALVSEWKTADLLTNSRIRNLAANPASSPHFDQSRPPALLRLIAVELAGSDYARGKFSAIARQINHLPHARHDAL